VLARNAKLLVVAIAWIAPTVSCSSKSPLHADAAGKADAAADARADAAVDAAITPAGPHYHYVAKQINVPTTNQQALEWGLDLTNSGMVQNQLGMILGSLSNMGFDIQGATNAAVAEGDIALLVDVDVATENFTNASTASLSTLQGSSSTPPACSGANDTYTCTGTGAAETCSGCAHQFGGNALFTLDTSGTINPPLTGSIVSGTMTAGPGTLTLPLNLAGTTPVWVDLIGAQIQATNMSATAFGSTTGVQPNTTSTGGVTLGGGLTTTEIDTKVYPAMATEFASIIAMDCPGCPNGANCTFTHTPSCNCAAGSTAATILGLFDTNQDCAVSTTEIENNSLIMSLFAPDVTINGMPALSFGINVTTVGAEFTVPGE
jgi:hypothetical protein